jgi:hypothetical protein
MKETKKARKGAIDETLMTRVGPTRFPDRDRRIQSKCCGYSIKSIKVDTLKLKRSIDGHSDLRI